jgi:hypothetical protein
METVLEVNHTLKTVKLDNSQEEDRNLLKEIKKKLLKEKSALLNVLKVNLNLGNIHVFKLYNLMLVMIDTLTLNHTTPKINYTK